MKCTISFIFLLLVLHLVSTSANYGNYGEAHDSSPKQAYDQSHESPKPNYGKPEEKHHEQNKEGYDESPEEEEEEDVSSSPRYTTLPKSLALDNYLSFSYYYQSCPEAEAIIRRKVNEWFHKDYTIAASLIRLHFHDCSVRGCDASILLNHQGSERKAKASKTLRGFELIDEIKAEIEKKCPKTVSCADILTAATRDATHLAGGPYWGVPFGRKDGKISVAEEADNLVPMGHETVTQLIELFQSLGLNVLDLVVLSGAHTIGRTSCGSVQSRLYNNSASNYHNVAQSIDGKYLDFLQRKCRWASDYTELDPETPWKFDNEYYKNLETKKGTLYTDQILVSDPRTSPHVEVFAKSRSVFHYQFGVSMARLGNVQVLTGEEGEIRTNCNFVNSNY